MNIGILNYSDLLVTIIKVIKMCFRLNGQLEYF